MEANGRDMVEVDLQKSSFLNPIDKLSKTTFEASELENLLAEQYEIVEYEDISRNGTRRSSTDSSRTSDTGESVPTVGSAIQNTQTALRYMTISSSNILQHADKSKFEQRLRQLTTSNTQLEEQIQILIDYQEDLTTKHNDLNQQHKDLQASESKLLSEVELLGGLFREEQSKTSKLLKIVQGLNAPDQYRRDDEYFKCAIEDLRYQIKSWSRNQAQTLPLSVPPPILNGVAGYVLGKLGHKESVGPKYEFLNLASPDWANYTRTQEGFKLILQAYVWRKLVELVFEGEGWAGLSTPLNSTSRESEVPKAYHTLSRELQPDFHSSVDQTAQFHSWRSTSARLLSTRTPTSHISTAITSIRNSIIQPLLAASTPSTTTFTSSSSLPQHHSAPPHSSSAPPKLDVQELDSIVEASLKLGADMAQQRAYYAFETLPVAQNGKSEFEPGSMYTCQGVKSSENEMLKIVQMVLAPRVVRWGTEGGKSWDACKQVVMMEVEVKTLERKELKEYLK